MNKFNSLFIVALAGICMSKNTEAGTAGLAQGTAVDAPDTTPESTVDPLASALVEIPARICVQIGQRKRYFDTREEALEALKDFTDRANKVPGSGGSRVFLTKEQKEAKAAVRAVLCKYAELQGKEGKNVAAMANALEDLVKQIPALLPLIEEYNSKPKEDAIQLSGNTTEVAQAIVTPAPEAGDVDPLAEFNM